MKAFVKTQSLFSKRIFARYVWNKLFRLSDLQNDYSLLEDILEIAYDEFVSYYKKSFVIPESANKYEIGRIARFFKSA